MHRANQAHSEWLLVRVSMKPLAKVAGQSKLVATAATIFIASKNSRRNPVPSTIPFGAIQWIPAWLPAVDTSVATLDHSLNAGKRNSLRRVHLSVTSSVANKPALFRCVQNCVLGSTAYSGCANRGYQLGYHILVTKLVTSSGYLCRHPRSIQESRQRMILCRVP